MSETLPRFSLFLKLSRKYQFRFRHTDKKTFFFIAAVLEENWVIERTPCGRILQGTEEFVRKNAERTL